MQASIYNIEPFDVAIGTTIKFSWTGNQVIKNKCIILDHDTNTEVYNNVIDSYRLEHTLDLTKINGMVNGKKYVAFITVFDQYGDESDIQTSGRIFLCLKTPTYKFSNVEGFEYIGFLIVIVSDTKYKVYTYDNRDTSRTKV